MRKSLVALTVCLLGSAALRAGWAEEPKAISVEPDAAARGGGGKYALLVGVGDYAAGDINDLRFTSNDARNLYRVLTDPARGGFPREQVILLCDDQTDPLLKPTLENVVEKLQAFRGLARGADMFVFFFSGHGLTQNGISYLLPSDCKTSLLDHWGLKVSQVEEYLEQMAPQVGLVLLDACRNVPVLRDDKGLGAGGMDATFADDVASLSQGEGRAVFSSCKQGQKSWEWDEKQAGVFTYFLTEGLSGKADRDKDGLLSLSETNAYVASKVKEWSLQHGKDQEPRLDLSVTGEVILLGKPRAPETGDLAVASTPPGAQVFIEGRLRGETPLTIRNMLPGEREVLVSLEGYGEERRTVVLEPGPGNRVDFELKEVVGSLRVAATPTGAEVVVDDVERGKAPVTVRDLGPGRHTVRVSRGGYFDYTATQEVEPGRVAELNVELRQIGQTDATTGDTGFLSVTSEPAGLTIYLDGRPVGKTPLPVLTVAAGDHRVELRSAEYVDTAKEITLERNKVSKFHHEADRATGSIQVSTDLPDATVLVDGKEQRLQGTSLSMNDVPLGRHTVEVRLPYGSLKREVVVGKGAPVIERFQRDQLLGDVTLIADKLVGGVQLDGRRIEGTLPLTLEGLLTGEHTVVVSDTVDGARWGGEATFQVEAGQTQVVRLELQQDFQPTVRTPTGERIVVGTPGQTRINPVDGAELVWVPGGTFQMGSNDGDGDEKLVHQVTVSGFWMYKCEVTVAQYRKFCEATNRRMPSGLGEADHPVVNVSWEDAQAYCKWAGARLPTEAEWEHASRGGKQLEYGTATGELSHDLTNYTGTADRDTWSGTSPVGSFPPNPFGLHDMAGNVWEWCQDWYGEYSDRSATDPTGPTAGERRVYRGGSWSGGPAYCRAAIRIWYAPTYCSINLGLRPVLAPPG